MSRTHLTVLVVGATGSIGSLVLEEAIRAGHGVRALVRNPAKARGFPSEAQVVVGDVTKPDTLSSAMEGVNAIVFTHGSDGGGKVGAETVDYGGVRNVLAALGSRPTRIALMTAIGATNRKGDYNRRTEAHDGKRRSERLVRASGKSFTIVRPGWFDYNAPNERRLVLLQGDKRQAGDSSDGVIARRQIAEVLVRSLTAPQAAGKTFELVATTGAQQEDFEALFEALDADPAGSLDAVHDTANMPLEKSGSGTTSIGSQVILGDSPWRTPVEELLSLPFLQPDQVKDSLHAYQLSKRGNSLRVMAEAVRWGKRGARVNTISSGIIITPLAKDELTGPRGAGYRRMIEVSAAGRPGTPDEVGTVGALLMGADGGFITGSDILMDGGVTAAYWYGELAPR